VEQQLISTARVDTVEDTQHQQLEEHQDTVEDTVVVHPELQVQDSLGGNTLLPLPTLHTPHINIYKVQITVGIGSKVLLVTWNDSRQGFGCNSQVSYGPVGS